MKYKIDLSNEKKTLFIPIIFLIIGLIFLMISLCVFIKSNNKFNRIDSLVQVYNIESSSYENDRGITMYNYIYHYMVDDKKYSCKSNISTDKKIEDKEIIIEYNSKNPSECKTPYDKNGVSTFLILFVILGFILLLIGLIVFLIKIKNILNKKHLAYSGLLIKDVPYEMVPSNISINGKTLYIIEAIIRLENGNMIKVKSAPRFDFKDKDDDNHVDVLIDKNNPNNNYVDFNINEIN